LCLLLFHGAIGDGDDLAMDVDGASDRERTRIILFNPGAANQRFLL